MNRRIVVLLFGLMMAVLLTACGGSSSGPATPATATGILVDAPVAGVSYISGSHSGVTGPDGSFTYEQGQTVKFFIGNVVLGETSAKGMLTLMDLVSGATDVTDPAVTKIAQLLQTLDTGATPGVITIPNYAAAAANVPAVNLSSTPAADLATILTAMGCTTPPVSALTAQNNFKGSVFNLYAGTYNGLYSGSSSGTWTLTIDSNGQMTGSADDGSISLTGSVSVTGATSFGGGGSTSSGDTFTGTINPATGTFSGTWGSNGTVKGQFSGAKAAPSVVVAISPESATVTEGATQQFTSTVSGDTNTLVTWSVQESSGGTISQSGLYTAPATTGTYHVVATSKANPTKYATSSVTVTAAQVSISVSVSPQTASISTGATQQFSASVTGSGNTSMTWSVQESNGGTVSQNGLYAAPSTAGTYHVVAASVADTSKTSSATVTVTSSTGGGDGTLMGGSVQGKTLSLAGTVTTFAGHLNSSASTDGIGTAAGFKNPRGITTDGTNLYVSDSGGNCIRKIVIATAEVSTLAGGSAGSTDGIGTAAKFNTPTGITTDGTNLYVADNGNHTIRKIVISTRAVTTLAGTAGVSGLANGTGSAASFSTNADITTDGINLYVTESGLGIRKIVIATGSVTTIAASYSDPLWSVSLGSTGITMNSASLYVTSFNYNQLYKIDMATSAFAKVAGISNSYGESDGPATSATFTAPWGITMDNANLYVADSSGQTIRKIDRVTGDVTTLAGKAGYQGSSDGTGSAVRFAGPLGITTDGISLYVVELSNGTIRRIQ